MRTARIPPRCSPSGCLAYRPGARSTSRAAPGATHYSSRLEGFRVSALDISAVALERGRRAAAERGLDVEWLCADLDEEIEQALPAGGFDLIVWVRYVHPELMPHLIARLDDGGTLLCEQHLATTAQVAGPTSAAFRLAPGTLLETAQNLQVLHSYEGPLVDPDGRDVALAQLVAVKRR